MLRFLLLPGFLAVTLLTAVAADVTHAWNWLGENDEVRLLHSIPPAPIPGSAEDRRDFEAVLKLQANRTSSDVAEARHDEHFRLEIVSEVLGPDFTAEKYPLVFVLLEKARQNESLLNSRLKKENRRLRPYKVHPAVKPLFEVDQYSYPSGHASGSYVLAALLGELFPEKKIALMARADAVGRSRIVAGVHYPSDVKQGQNLGRALVAALLSNRDFQRDLSEAKAEIVRRLSAAAASR